MSRAEYSRCPALGPRPARQPEPVVLPERLRMQAADCRGH